MLTAMASSARRSSGGGRNYVEAASAYQTRRLWRRMRKWLISQECHLSVFLAYASRLDLAQLRYLSR